MTASPSPRRCRSRAPTCSRRKMADGNTQPHHRLGQRHRHRPQEAARRPGALLRRRRRHRPAGGQGQPRASSAGSRCRSSRTPTSTASIPPRSTTATDADGQVILGKDKLPQRLPMAHHRPQGEGRQGRRRPLRLPRLHLRSGTASSYDPEYNQTKVFTITDRPVYRPEQTVQFKFWVRHAKYDQPDTSDFAGKSFTVQIHNPQGRQGLREVADGRRVRRPDRRVRAAQGRHARRLRHPGRQDHGGGSFRVEEYKKPEFEVTIEAPEGAGQAGREDHGHHPGEVLLRRPGDQGQGQVQGDCAASYSSDWYPRGTWDWFYGRGYWWFASDYAWYPGWGEWGCRRPRPVLVARRLGAARSRPGKRGRDRPRRHVKVADRHAAGQGTARQPGPQVHHHRRGGRRVAAHHRRHRQRAGGPQAVPGLRLGRSRPLPRRRHHQGQLQRPDARQQAGRRARAS